MTLKEAYESVESNYDNVLKRLGSEGMIKRFAVKFIDDPTFGELKMHWQQEMAKALSVPHIQ